MDRETARRRARALVAQMSLEEKAGQLSYSAPPIPHLGEIGRASCRERV